MSCTGRDTGAGAGAGSVVGAGLGSLRLIVGVGKLGSMGRSGRANVGAGAVAGAGADTRTGAGTGAGTVASRACVGDVAKPATMEPRLPYLAAYDED